ncbi:uncharacterized protein BDW47DRAFT_97106 [Aspergillus candidus]|uniref:Uncharacterized protein n=1 Tax=Aspergillus candidus TaxID=41067 RepID=A0A2I2FP79_ASPCN|nr:hypothetical protein BDW47DRAFT_97106 [Aspergillus candidus]PLB42418.1 hypothetical protein BDW47DRAFT_97106 [Aspergillus candidus]
MQILENPVVIVFLRMRSHIGWDHRKRQSGCFMRAAGLPMYLFFSFAHYQMHIST